jgi:hypothetical protein
MFTISPGHQLGKDTIKIAATSHAVQSIGSLLLFVLAVVAVTIFMLARQVFRAVTEIAAAAAASFSKAAGKMFVIICFSTVLIIGAAVTAMHSP